MATAAKAPVYVSWDEVCLSADKGRKEVHYYLKRRNGVSDLAVVGTEKDMRHMLYHYAIKDMSLLSVSNPLSLSKLRTRREVVDWLNSIVSVADLRQHQDIREDGKPIESTDAGLNDLTTLKDVHARRLGQHATEFMWLGSPWTCRKKRRHYTSFCRNGVRISVHDFVYVLAEEDKRLVAYLDDMYEDTRGNRMVVVRWFHKIDEVGILFPRKYNDREILFSLCLQNLSIDCVDGLATVLSPQHYGRFFNVSRHTQPEPFVCQRLFDNDELKPFDITNVKGYWNQELLKHISLSSPSRAQPSLGNLKIEDTTTGFVGSRPNKRLHFSKESNISSLSVPRNGPVKSCQEYYNGSSVVSMEISTSKEGCFNGSLSGQNVVTEKSQQNFDIGSEVEILSQDSGIRGCWFRALVIKKHNNKVKLQYKDVKDAEDEAKNLEEWVLATKLAAPDTLGIWTHGRTILRPSPSSHKGGRVSWVVNVGSFVDAWWNEGWWEGIVVRKESEDRLHIYFPGEKETHIFGHGDLRHSQEWLVDGWKHLKERPELVSVLLGDSTVMQTVKESCNVILEKHTTRSNGDLSTEKQRGEVALGNSAGKRLEVSEGVQDLSKDNRLAQLRWKTSGKKRRCRSPVNKVRLSLEKNGNNVSKESGMQIKEKLFIPSSLKVDHDNCKFINDSLFNSSVVSPLTNLVMSR